MCRKIVKEVYLTFVRLEKSKMLNGFAYLHIGPYLAR